MDTNINIPKKEIAPGVFSTGGTATMPTVNPIKGQTNVITPQSLQPQTPIQLPQTPEITTPPQPTPNLASPYLEELKLNESEQKAQQYQTAGIDQLIKDTLALEGEAQTRSEEMAKAGVGTLKQDLQNINSQILKKQAEVQQDDITLVANMRAEERRDTLLPFAEMGKAKLAGDAAIMRALKNAEIGVLNATAIAKQGDIALAQQTAEEAVAVKYAPYKARIERYDTIVKAIEPYLSSAEKKEVAKQQFKGQMALKEIEKAEENEKAIQKMIVEATPNAPANIIANAKAIADKGGSSLEVAQALGQYGGDYLGNKVKLASIARDNASIRKTNAEIDKINKEIKAMETPISTTNLPNTPNGIAQRLMASAQNDKQLDATERQQLTKARTVLSQLELLQENISKQNKTGFIKGKVGNFLEKFGLDTDVGVINAQLQAITPNLARGVYGEVGVLTDNDIRLYRTTLPRLDRQEDQNDAILALTMKTVQKAIENTLTGASNSGIDVSGWTQDYIAVTRKINEIEDRIGVSKQAVNQIIREDANTAQAIKELYQAGLTDGEILDALNAR
ncbi:hypothetical protein K9M47_03065 [Candidatus Gracilibacteria bacterium]|nr:hypothetical protein [Candidatus Gracilibacteria bacterium]